MTTISVTVLNNNIKIAIGKKGDNEYNLTKT